MNGEDVLVLRIGHRDGFCQGGKHTPSVATIAKIELALKQTTKPGKVSKGR